MNLPAGVVRFRQRVSGRDGSPGSDVDEAAGAEGAVVAEPAARAGWGWVAGLVLAIVATAGAVVLMRSYGLDGLLRPQPASIPQLTFERVAFAPGTVTLSVRNTGPAKISVAQVLVDEAYWVFSAEPAGPLDRLESTRIRVPYPWIAGEPLAIAVVDSTGTTHEHAVEAAAETPVASGRTLAGYVLLGTYMGVIPVFLGLLFLPTLARLGRKGLRFLLGVTGGLLVFLAVDALAESLELAGTLSSALQGPALVFAGAVGTYAVLAYLSHRQRTRRSRRAGSRDAGAVPSGGALLASPLALAYLVAVGIGLHNLGEGLAVGSAHARGEVALGTVSLVSASWCTTSPRASASPRRRWRDCPPSVISSRSGWWPACPPSSAHWWVAWPTRPSPAPSSWPSASAPSPKSSTSCSVMPAGTPGLRVPSWAAPPAASSSCTPPLS